MIYILGTSHEYQRNDNTCSPNSIVEFKQYLKTVCQNCNVRAIGEEMSQESLEFFNRKISIPKVFTEENGTIIHKYCDPESDEKRKLGIRESGFYSQGKKFPVILQPQEVKNLSQEEADLLEWKEDLKREPVWLCKILELNKWPLLFICGSKHVESYRKLLDAASFSVKIVNKNWEP